ncbi:uncharacterized protein RCH25_005173 [Pelodytes ibericus]
MMGPWTLLVAVIVCASVLPAQSKPLGFVSHNDLGLPRRFRRSLPYEADMLSYLPPESMRNEPVYPEISQAILARFAAYPQEELLAQALERMGALRRVEPTQDNLSIQGLFEEGLRRDKEALYLANLLHWLNQGHGYPEQLQGLRGPMRAEGDILRSFQDYDETGTGPARPQVSRSQMAQALSQYRQDRDFQGPALHSEEPNMEGLDEDMLRYLVTRVLSAMSETDTPQHLAPPLGRRLRRSIDEELDGNSSPNLLRVKRLGESPEAEYGGSSRRRNQGETRARPLTDHRITERLLKYLPD